MANGLVPGGDTLTQILTGLAMTLGNQGAKQGTAAWVADLQRQREMGLLQEQERAQQEQRAARDQQQAEAAYLRSLQKEAAGLGVMPTPEYGPQDYLSQIATASVDKQIADPDMIPSDVVRGAWEASHPGQTRPSGSVQRAWYVENVLRPKRSALGSFSPDRKILEDLAAPR